MSDWITILRLGWYYSQLSQYWSEKVVALIRRLQNELKNYIKVFRRWWAWQPAFKINLIYVWSTRTPIPNLIFLLLIKTEILKLERETDERICTIDSPSVPIEEYIQLIGPATPLLPLTYICPKLVHPFLTIQRVYTKRNQTKPTEIHILRLH